MFHLPTRDQIRKFDQLTARVQNAVAELLGLMHRLKYFTCPGCGAGCPPSRQVTVFDGSASITLVMHCGECGDIEFLLTPYKEATAIAWPYLDEADLSRAPGE